MGVSARIAGGLNGGGGPLLLLQYEEVGSPLVVPDLGFVLFHGFSVPIAHEIAVRVDFVNQMGGGEAVHCEHGAVVHAVIAFDALVFQFLSDEPVFDGGDVSALRGADRTVHDFSGELADVDGLAGLADFGHLIEVHENHAVSPRADEDIAFMHFHAGGVEVSRLAALFLGSVDAEALAGEPRIGFDGFGDVVLDAFHGSPVLAGAGVVAAGDIEEILGDVRPMVCIGVELDFKAEHFRLLI